MNKYKAPPREHLMNAIAIVRDGEVLRFVKYHRIDMRTAHKPERFYSFLDKEFPTWQYCNFYGGVSKQYRGRIYRDRSGNVSVPVSAA